MISINDSSNWPVVLREVMCTAPARQQQTVADEIDGVRTHREESAADLDQPDGG